MRMFSGYPFISSCNASICPGPFYGFIDKFHFFVFGEFGQVGYFIIGHHEPDTGNAGIAELHCIMLFFCSTGGATSTHSGRPELQLPGDYIFIVYQRRVQQWRRFIQLHDDRIRRCGTASCRTPLRKAWYQQNVGAYRCRRGFGYWFPPRTLQL